ncbi:TonB-dependent receptor plug domain-containing protein [Aliikangiella coralliicola]|uniref:TonB-dependent receptor n=1 Tax=Aliikangiella coralliicola TaxID=2592383 RepID=A0A545UA90_9GAMM|nr:TonB-dependent receptor [Aliikangiella coralliicola]TQV86386.1 TonB-dependent receptor [Aliikangiella coralliicola]
MELKSLVKLMGIALTGSALLNSTPLIAAEEIEDSAQEEDENKVVITGSRIKRTDVEGVTPVTIITAEEIERQGHANVYEAIRNLTANTGGVLDEQQTNSFTAAAQAVNLRGFGPGRTLVLLNGNRLPTNPKPYGGEDNFVNLALIPTTAVDRVEYLSSGGAAIYGSDAIAGVINVVLRDDYEGTQISARYTDTKDGGGETYRLNLMGGFAGDKYSFNYGFEVDKRTGLFGRDRDWLDEVTDSPAEDPWLVNDRDILIAYPFGRNGLPNWSYQDPGAAACDTNPNFDYSNRPGRGNFCGHDSTGDRALRAPRDRFNAFANYTYQLNTDHEFFVNALAWKSDADAELYYTGWWQQVSVVQDITAANPTWLYDLYYQRTFAPEEVPNEQSFDESAYVVNFGFEGSLTDELDYKLALSLTDYDYKEAIARFSQNGGLMAFFGVDGNDPNRNRLLDSWGTYLLQPSDLAADGYTSLNGLNMYNYFNNGELDGMYGLSTADGGSYARSVSFEVSGDVTELDAGMISFAAVVEWNEQGYNLDIDPTTDNGEYVGWSGVGGRGDRDHFAVGAEFLIPLTDELEATVAARYDDYQDDSEVGGSPTYQLGLSWRPSDDFLVRAAYGTTFRAPDLHRLFADNNQFFNNTIDYYACMLENNATPETANELFKECAQNGDSVNTRQNTQGDLSLEEETGFSANFGVVWSPIEELDLSLDIYRIRIEDMVTTLSASTYSQLEAECRLGFDANGDAVDGNSAYCQELYTRIQRQAGPVASEVDPINEVFLSSINMGLQEQTGADVNINYKLETQDIGEFNFGVKYSYVDEIKTQVLRTDEVDEDVRDTSYYNNPYRHRATISTSWSYNDLTTTLYFNRVGSTRNWAGDDRTPAYTTANLHVNYRYDKHLSGSFTIVNLTDSRPPEEAKWESWPFYNDYAYTNGGIGTEYFISLNYEF